MKDTTSNFPNSIDDLVFFQDISISQVPIMEDFYILLNAKNYTAASEYLNNSGVFFYGAWCLNLLENRTYAVSKYLMSLEDLKLMTYSDSEPSESEIYDGMNWIK